MKKVVIIDETDFSKLAVESTHIANDISLAKDCVDDEKCMKEALRSMERHIGIIQSIINKKD